MSEEFDWDKDDSVVVKTQLGIAVYPNNDGHIVIRQEGMYGSSEESFVYVAASHLPSLIEALQRYLPKRQE